MSDAELSLATRAAWLSYIGGLTQEEIASRLNVSRVKVARLVAAAQRAGRIRIFIESGIVECMELERRLCARFGLASCTVAPEIEHVDLPLRALGVAGASWLQRRLEQGRDDVIGIGHGRTLAALVSELPRQPRPGLRFVSLLGSLTRKSAAHPFDVIHRLAETMAAEAYFLPAPLFADSLEDKQVLTAQKSIGHVLDLAASASLYLVGVGEVGPRSQLRATGMIREDEFAAAAAAGAVGELLGTFLDAAGLPVATEVNGRAVALPLSFLRGKEVVAVAGGSGKIDAIGAVLASGVVTGLITDEATARLLNVLPDPAAIGAPRSVLARVA